MTNVTPTNFLPLNLSNVQNSDTLVYSTLSRAFENQPGGGGGGAPVGGPYITYIADGTLTGSRVLSNGNGTTAFYNGTQSRVNWDAYNTEILTAAGTTGLGAGRVLTAGTNITLTPGVGTLTIDSATTGAPVNATFITETDETPTLSASRRLVAGEGTTPDTTNAGQMAINWEAFSNDFLFASGTQPYPGLQALPSPVGRTLTAGANITFDTMTPGILTIAASGGGGLLYWAETTGTVSGRQWTAWSPIVAGDCVIAAGTNGFQLQAATLSSAGGNLRGTRAVDLQRNRIDANSIASGSDSALLGGYNVRAVGARSIAGGGQSGRADGDNSVQFGGNNNQANSSQSVAIGGGNNNVGTVGGGQSGASVIGGNNCDVTGTPTYCGIYSGTNNLITGTGSNGFIGGGSGNTVQAAASVIIGGGTNTVTNTNSGIIAGSSNSVSANAGVAIGGSSQSVSGANSIAAGNTGVNNVSGTSCFVAGNTGTNAYAGDQHVIIGSNAVQVTASNAICIGSQNGLVNAARAILIGSSAGAGPSYAQSTGTDSVAIGGIRARAQGTNAVCIGGDARQANNTNATAIGGQSGYASGVNSVSIGGNILEVSGTAAVSIGGNNTFNGGDNSGIIGGITSIINPGSLNCFIGAGATNNVTGINGAIVGGSSNTINTISYGGIFASNNSRIEDFGPNFAQGSVIAGGFAQLVQSNFCAVIGGNTNEIELASDNSAILAGTGNQVAGGSTRSVVIGGFNNLIGGLTTNSVLIGGANNSMQNTSGTSGCLGGQSNQIDACNDSFTCGGSANGLFNSANASAICGGNQNGIYRAGFNFMGGGQLNLINPNVGNTGTHNGIIGGYDNQIVLAASRSCALGGREHEIRANECIAAGGTASLIDSSSNRSAIIGGINNNISGSITTNSCIIGGDENLLNTTGDSVAIGGEVCDSSILTALINRRVMVGAPGPLGRDNLFSVGTDGSTRTRAFFVPGGADYAELFESSDGTSFPLGATVVMETDGSGFIRMAKTGEIPFGVISDNYSLLGNAAETAWHKTYLRDDHGRPILEKKEITFPSGKKKETIVQKFHPDFDKTKKYIPRFQRPEWNPIGIMGQCKVLPGQPVDPRWIFMKNVEKNGKTYHLYLIR